MHRSLLHGGRDLCAGWHERVLGLLQWCVRLPLHLDGPSQPSLLFGSRAGTELACMSCITGDGSVVKNEGGGLNMGRGGEGGVMMFVEGYLTFMYFCVVIM